LHGVTQTVDGRVELAPDVAEGLETDILSAFAAAGDPPAELSGQTLPMLRAVAARSLRRQVTLDKPTTVRAAAAAVERLVEEGRLVREGASVRLPGSRSAAGLEPALVAAMDRLERSLAIAAPPLLAGAARDAGCSTRGVRELERTGRIVLVEPDLAYATPTYRDLAARALAMATATPLTPASFRDATGTSRRYVMAILEDLDRRGILRRTEAGHVPGRRAATASEIGR
jgi:hypothetical protein